MPVLVVGLFVNWYADFSLGAKLVGLFLYKKQEKAMKKAAAGKGGTSV